eukprot:6197899-Pleurochrysis_carterae.AAC.2
MGPSALDEIRACAWMLARGLDEIREPPDDDDDDKADDDDDGHDDDDDDDIEDEGARDRQSQGRSSPLSKESNFTLIPSTGTVLSLPAHLYWSFLQHQTVALWSLP